MWRRFDCWLRGGHDPVYDNLGQRCCAWCGRDLPPWPPIGHEDAIEARTLSDSEGGYDDLRQPIIVARTEVGER